LETDKSKPPTRAAQVEKPAKIPKKKKDGRRDCWLTEIREVKPE